MSKKLVGSPSDPSPSMFVAVTSSDDALETKVVTETDMWDGPKVDSATESVVLPFSFCRLRRTSRPFFHETERVGSTVSDMDGIPVSLFKSLLLLDDMLSLSVSVFVPLLPAARQEPFSVPASNRCSSFCDRPPSSWPIEWNASLVLSSMV